MASHVFYSMLRHAREDAEDILDDQQEIEQYRSRPCWDILRGAANLCLGCFLGIARIIRSGSVQILQLTLRSPRMLAVPLPVTAPSTTSCSSMDSSGWCFSCLCRSIDFSMHCSRLTLYWIIDAIAVARSFRNSFYRNWSYELVDATSYHQENATTLDFLLTAIPRWNVKKRILKVESIVTDVKKSSLLSIASKSPLDEIANKDRSRIRTAGNREVFGREALRDYIMEKLRETQNDDAPSSSTSPCYSVIGIYGVAGSGKTTFARYTRDYLKEECKEEIFEIIMCIHVSATFTVADIFHEMLTDITKKKHSNISHHEELEDKLKELLCGKRFFLILDDLWVKTKNDPLLQQIISPLKVGKRGSKILVTARTKVAAEVLCIDEPMKMPDLDEHQYFSMFMHYALGGTSVSSDEFERAGRKIAKKLHQSPIAAVIVAGRLGANRDLRFWKNTAEHDMLNDTVDALWWSYQQLSPDIRRCFEYCNMFPRRFKMAKDDLVRLWIAQGFVKTSFAAEHLEAIAEGYIQELVSCSYLEEVETRRDVDCFIIHDLLHDLADMVTGTECFRIENESSQRGESWKGDIPQDVRHLFVQNYDAKLITEKILGLENLRTLIVNVVGGKTQVEEQVIDNICKKLLKLRVLVFALITESTMQQEVLVPESVSQLKYLRYLAFRKNRFCKISLPSTLNKLQHIQLLDFGDGDISEFTFAELVNLRHIFCWQVVKLGYVGMLSSLQTLPGFEVSNEQGCELKQLRDLNKLQGTLRIGGLENVQSKEEALEANIVAKQLTELSLWWGNCNDTRCSPDVKSDVLEALCPPAVLKKLELGNSVGRRYPCWMLGKNNGGPELLEELYIFECGISKPPSGLVEAFLHLRVLRLFSCSWDKLPDNMEHLKLLKELEIVGCLNIRSLPSLPKSLERFTLKSCNNEFMESCKILGVNWQKIDHIIYKHIC